MRAILVIAALVSVASVAPALRAQDAPDALDELSEAAIASMADEARAHARADRHDRALATYDRLEQALMERGRGDECAAFACEHAEAVMHASSTEALDLRLDRTDWLLANGFASAAGEPDRGACALRGGLALASLRAPDASAADRREAAWLAALWLAAGSSRFDAAGMRAAGIDPAVVAAAIAALPADVREEHARAMAAPSAAVAAGERGTLAGLGAAIARMTHARQPERIASCHEEWFDEADSGTLVCSWSRLPERESGNGYPSERHIVERTPSGAYRGVATITDFESYDCGYGLVYEVEGFARLTDREHGIDGWLVTIEEGTDDPNTYDQATQRGGERIETDVTATLCDRASGTCIDALVARRRCFVPEGGRRRCTEDWQARVTVTGGRITLARGRGRIPDTIPRAIGMAEGGAARSPTGMLPPPPEGSRCHLETLDARPPLNVRAEASQTSAVAGTLANGTVIRVLDRHRGWVRIAAPVAGWVWSRNVRRVCQ